MSFSTTQIQFLQRLVNEKPARRRAGDVSRFFCEHFSLGVAVGYFVEYRAEHHGLAESLLRTHSLPVNALGALASRADVAAYGGLSEKSLSAAPHARSVAVKFVGACTLDGQAQAIPAGSYLVVTPDVAERFVCDRLMVVENFETFRQLEDYLWIDYQGLAVLIVFRGDTILPIGDALTLVRARVEPIWAFVDFDPAGLLIANGLPQDRLQRIVLPNLTWLRSSADTARGRQLFDDQETACSQALEQALHPSIQTQWNELRALRSAVTQERMKHADVGAELNR